MSSNPPPGILNEPLYPLDTFRVAANKAADEILELAPGDDRLRDALNLMVNASIDYADAANTSTNLGEVVAANYTDTTLEDVREWILGG